MSDRIADPPLRLRNLRACLRCHLIKSLEQFREYGCDNCHWTDVHSYSTPVFKGMLSMMDPRTSWVARWHKQEHRCRGLYAMQVVGSLPNDEDVE